MADYRVTDDDRERVSLLSRVAKGGMRSLGHAELCRLQELVEAKDYAHSRKAERSKAKLLASINSAIYDAAGGGP